MRRLYLECGALRADDLGRYGYRRNTSPRINRLAHERVCCANYYASDAPCLPSRAPLIVRWPGLEGGRVDDALHYYPGLPPTLAEMLATSPKGATSHSLGRGLSVVSR